MKIKHYLYNAFIIETRKTKIAIDNVDAIRALTGIVADGRESMRITDETMGVRQEFLA